MTYSKQTWANGVDGATPINADRLNHLETQAEETVAELTPLIDARVPAFADPGADRLVFWDDSASEFAALTAATPLSISGTSMSVSAASTSDAGAVELATDGETTTGTDTGRAVTPSNLTAFINNAGVARGKAATKYKTVACVLRRVDASTWAFLNDSGHAPTGVTSVSITSTYIRLTYDFTATKVSTLVVTPDESFAAVAGFRVGASVGLTYADIYCYISTNTSPSDPGALSTANANLWVYGQFEVA